MKERIMEVFYELNKIRGPGENFLTVVLEDLGRRLVAE